MIRRKPALGCALVAAVWLGGCQSLQKDAFRLSETTLETRQMQTRQFDAVSEAEILAASSGVLQDLGYAIDEVEKELGVLSASKRADASNGVDLVGRIGMDVASCLLSFLIACDNEFYKGAKDFQDIRLTLVVLPSQTASGAHSVRLTMQRVVWDRNGRVAQQETISDPAVYQAFFTKLSRSVFFEKEGA